jgi:hypothetical protein
LLIGHASVHRYQNLPAGSFRQTQKFTIRLASQADLGHRLAFMPNKLFTEVSRQAFVQ